MIAGAWRRAATRLLFPVLCLVVGLAPDAAAQPRRPSSPASPSTPAPPRGATPDPRLPRGAPSDTGRAGRDSTILRTQLVDWTPDDSMMLALIARRGYRLVRYQAKDVGFATAGRTMTLVGTDSARAAVQRDSTLLVADSIAFSDSTKVITATGDTIVMRDPSQVADVLGHRQLTYDVERREGRTRDFSTVANSGDDWQIRAHRAAFSSDSTNDRHTVYGRDGIITSCLDSVPHYHFLAKELKRISGNVIVARPAILYVQDVPVMWLPFIFQDIRSGRRSGILQPRIGFAELVRNSPTYRRTAENLGYYFALNDFMDAQVTMDWRSAARATVQDPGWVKLNGEVRYRWLDRFISGSLALSQHTLSSGNRNTAISWSHAQEFSSKTRLNTNLNYVTSTSVQRQTIINPMAAMATIASQLNLVRQQGPFTVNLGGTRRQYPGRSQVDQSFPSLNIASKPLELGEWFVMNPSLQYGVQQTLNLDATGDFSHRYIDRGGVLDSVRLKRNTSATSLTLATPFKILDFQVQSGLRFSQQVLDYPQIITRRDPADTSLRIDRVYSGTYESSLDFDVSIGLPQFFQGTWNLGPSISASNVGPGGYAVRTFRTNGDWITQNKRLSYGLGVSPTAFHLYRGFGRVQRFRHSVTPTFSYSYSPAAAVSDEFLAALGKTQQGFLGSLAQNRVMLSVATNIEAKLRAPGDSSDEAGEKVKILSLQFTSLTYDFERKRQTGNTGFATDRFGYTFRSDLLPGFDLGVDYSLFQGDVDTDSAKFSPYREAVRASFQLDENSWIVRSVGRLFGVTPSGDGKGRTAASMPEGAGGLVSGRGDAQGFGATTGTRSRGAVQEIPSGQGFTAGFTVSAQRQRPPVGGRVVDYDATLICRDVINPIAKAICEDNARRAPQTSDPNAYSPTGGTFIKVPPTTSVGVRTSFNLTPKWSAAWSTTYDVERSEFASQVVTLQRELHDWRAIFGFTQAPNGNFAFTFFISLKAQPEIKLDYDRQTYRPPTASRTP